MTKEKMNQEIEKHKGEIKDSLIKIHQIAKPFITIELKSEHEKLIEKIESIDMSIEC